MATIDNPCVLLAEDEPMVVMLLQDLLEAAGYRVLVAERLDDGVAWVNSETIHVAILDVTLGKEESFPIADALLGRNIPFLFASGYGRESIPERFDGVEMLQKPYDMNGIKVALGKLVAKV